MFFDIDCVRKKKYNQNAFGDVFMSKRNQETGRLIAVLSDGLGSGIKADILATMTSVMLLKFIEADSDLGKSCEIIMNSLPVCQVRKISYSTFTALDCDYEGNVKIAEEGNPRFLWIRKNAVMSPAYDTVVSQTFPNRKMRVYELKLEINDRLIFCSDGVTQAGLGSRKYPLGLGEDGLKKLILEEIAQYPDISSRDLARYIVKKAEFANDDRNNHDDTSAVSLYCRNPRRAVVFTGPPYYADKDNFYAKSFAEFKGKKAVCGGTTANLISRELHLPLRSEISLNAGNVPPVLYMDGIDLVTEGVLTLSKACEYLEKGDTSEDAAGQLTEFFLNSDQIVFMVGSKVNQAHYDPNLPVEIAIRRNVIKKITSLLKDKYMKDVKLQYM